jgi:hypothetical protein
MQRFPPFQFPLENCQFVALCRRIHVNPREHSQIFLKQSDVLLAAFHLLAGVRKLI